MTTGSPGSRRSRTASPTRSGDLYGDLHEHGATVLATPFSRMFVDVNRRRDDYEHAAGEVRSRRGVVRTHTTRDVAIFARPLGLPDLEARLQALYDPYYEIGRASCRE